MTHWYETAIDRQLREATERGEFDNLPGQGKPLRGHGEEYEDDWWVKDWLEREGATAGMIPPTLALRRETEEVAAKVDRLRGEREVRDYIEDLNERIHQATVGRMDGPPVILRKFKADVVVDEWRSRR